MFLSRKALQEAWVVSGRKLSELPQQAAMRALTLALALILTPTQALALALALSLTRR